METTKVSERREFINELYYGDGGTGKTTGAAHMANLGRVLYVDAEAGIKKQPLINLGVQVDNIELLTLGEQLTFRNLEEAFWEIKRDLDDDPDSWVGTIWDSGTEIYHALLDEIVDQRVDKAGRLKRQGKAVAELMLDRFFVDRDNYGVMSEKIRFLMRRFRDLPCHFVSCFLERRDQDERTGEVRVGPSITPGLQGDVVGWHDLVCRTDYDENKDLYLGAFRPIGVRQGKDRYGVLPAHMVDPTFDRILAYVNGDLTEEVDPRMAGLRKEEETEVAEPEGSDDGESNETSVAERVAAARRKGSRAASRR